MLEKYENQKGDEDYAPLKKAAADSLAQHKDDSIYNWRLHRLLADIAEKSKDNDTLAKEGNDFRLLTGAEVDILKDGQLDFPDDLLAELDVVVASIHGAFSNNEAEMTRRLIRAAENPFVQILGHMTGRLLLEREGYKVNQRAVIDACAETGTWLRACSWK